MVGWAKSRETNGRVVLASQNEPLERVSRWLGGVFWMRGDIVGRIAGDSLWGI